MKKLFVILIAGFVLVTIHGVSAVFADGPVVGHEGQGIPLSKLAGNFVQTSGGSLGSITDCLKPDFSATENCSTAGAVPLALNLVGVAQVTQDRNGNACVTSVLTEASPVTFGTFPPLVIIGAAVSKVTNYDPVTASGDTSFTTYTGGKCNGSTFDNSGATVGATGTNHFVASQKEIVWTMLRRP
jgi:hypothetical protein